MIRMYYIKKNTNKKLCQSALMLLSKYLHFKIVKFMNSSEVKIKLFNIAIHKYFTLNFNYDKVIKPT